MKKNTTKSRQNVTNISLDRYKYIIDNEQNDQSIEKIIEQIVNYFETIIGCMPGNVYWFDKNLIAVGCNKNVLDLFGLNSIDEFKGLTFEEMEKLGDWSRETQVSFKTDTLEVLKTGKAKLGIEEPPIPDPDGRMVYFLSSRVPLFDQNKRVIGVIGISIDITERKEMETKLLEAKELAEAANHAKTEFMENMSHDFKTPLNGIYGVVQILRAREEDLPDDLRELVIGQEKSVLRLKKMVESILDFNKLATGKIEIQEDSLNLFEIIESIAHNLSFQTKDKELDIIIKYPMSVPRYLIGDSYCVTSVILNLMSNAVKFTDKGNVCVEVKVLSKKEDKISIKISVTDTGAGIPENKIEQIFERFHRLEPSNTGKKGGHGIGLAIVKELINKLNGKIKVKSTLGKGSTFSLIIPFKIQNVNA